MHNGGLQRSCALFDRSIGQNGFQLSVQPHHQNLLLLDGVVTLSNFLLVSLNQSILLREIYSIHSLQMPSTTLTIRKVFEPAFCTDCVRTAIGFSKHGSELLVARFRVERIDLHS